MTDDIFFSLCKNHTCLSCMLLQCLFTLVPLPAKLKLWLHDECQMILGQSHLPSAQSLLRHKKHAWVRWDYQNGSKRSNKDRYRSTQNRSASSDIFVDHVFISSCLKRGKPTKWTPKKYMFLSQPACLAESYHRAQITLPQKATYHNLARDHGRGINHWNEACQQNSSRLAFHSSLYPTGPTSTNCHEALQLHRRIRWATPDRNLKKMVSRCVQVTSTYGGTRPVLRFTCGHNPAGNCFQQSEWSRKPFLWRRFITSMILNAWNKWWGYNIVTGHNSPFRIQVIAGHWPPSDLFEKTALGYFLG